jgi:hypothetical protein
LSCGWCDVQDTAKQPVTCTWSTDLPIWLEPCLHKLNNRNVCHLRSDISQRVRSKETVSFLSWIFLKEWKLWE